MDPVYRPGEDYLSCFRTKFEEWRGEVQIKRKGALGLRVEGPLGFAYSIAPDNVVVEFAYPVAISQPGNKIAALDFGVPVQPFSSLLGKLVDEASWLLGTVCKLDERAANRIGVIANARMTREEQPPGMTDLLDHVGKPWPAGLRVFTGTILAELGSSEQWVDQCHHSVSADLTSDTGEVEVKLDWQRLSTNSAKVTARHSEVRLAEAVRAALKYFDLFGEGGLDYDRVRDNRG